jgi:membrane protease YdiL (CAAX protease family)
MPTLLTWVAVVTGSLLARQALGLTWNLEPGEHFWWQVFVALLLIAGSDALLFGLLRLIWADRFLARYSRLTWFFSPQETPQILASGLLASGEEWLFRGVVLQGVAAGWGTGIGIAVSAALFGLAHLLRERNLEPFVLWAVWEGVLLGLVYVLTGSMLVAMCVHSLHDIGGFTLFALQRHTGWLLMPVEEQSAKQPAADER